MFLTGVVVGCLLGTTVCLALALRYAAEAEASWASEGTTLVPLHVSPSTLVSLN